jgi:hypothetical protein
MFIFKSKAASNSITIARGVLESIFDECDRYDSHETGGRLIGTYTEKNSHYDIQLQGVLPPGPAAQRSATRFIQDGEYQEALFRKIEEEHPNIEHLGNWHTHHCNGLATLSQGDHATYHRIVNHEKHNTNFFYALLVVRKTPGRDTRYSIKHFIFHRNSNRVDEVPLSDVRIVDAPLLLPHTPEREQASSVLTSEPRVSVSLNAERVKDQEFFSDFYPGLKALFSKSTSTLYWKGNLELVDGSHAQVVAMEDSAEGVPVYSITTDFQKPGIAELIEKYKDHHFKSARHAVLKFQADINRTLYQVRKG